MEKKIEVDSLDNILRENDIRYVNHIHMTINGAEPEALEGMKEVLKQSGLRIFIRSTLLNRETNQPLYEELADILLKHGFKVIVAKDQPQSVEGNIYGYKLST